MNNENVIKRQLWMLIIKEAKKITEAGYGNIRLVCEITEKGPKYE